MTIREQVEACAKELGAKLVIRVDSENRLEVEIEAPHKHVWSAIDLHEAITCWDVTYEDMTRDEAWGMLLEDMQDGLEDCEVIDCEWCGYNAEVALARAEYMNDVLSPPLV